MAALKTDSIGSNGDLCLCIEINLLVLRVKADNQKFYTRTVMFAAPPNAFHPSTCPLGCAENLQG